MGPLPARRRLNAANPAAGVNTRRAIRASARGVLLYQQGQLPAALRSWKRAVGLDARLDYAWENIGLACTMLGQNEAAREAYQRAAELNPDSAGPCRGLSNALRSLGRRKEARAANVRARALDADPEALTRHGMSLLRAGMLEEATRAFTRVVRLRRRDPTALFNLARTRAVAQDERAARRHLKRALALDPEHGAAAFLMAALEGRSPASAPPGYVTTHFDEYAGDYDRHLVACLGYRGPQVLWRAVTRVLERDGWSGARLCVLDAGCGTGLAAAVLRPAARQLVGVDLSRGMIARARAREAYDELIVGDLVGAMRSRPGRFDLVFAADVFCYFGDLEPAFEAARHSLAPGGLLALTVEACEGDGYRLEPHARYAHSRAYLRRAAAAAGFVVCSARMVAIRYQRGKPVRGIVTVLKRI